MAPREFLVGRLGGSGCMTRAAPSGAALAADLRDRLEPTELRTSYENAAP
jgi:hypothetical protein